MRFLTTVLLILSLAATSAMAEEKTGTDDRVPETLGFVEWVVMKDTRLRLKARLDTGAKTSSLHAVNVEEFTRNEERWVSFEIPLGDHEDQPAEGEFKHDDVVIVLERPVRRTQGGTIPTPLCGRSGVLHRRHNAHYPVLADRSRQVLLPRTPWPPLHAR